jgi:hypothetical protein
MSKQEFGGQEVLLFYIEPALHLNVRFGEI